MPSCPFKINGTSEVAVGVTTRHIEFADGRAEGRSITVRLGNVDMRIYVFYELVNKSFNPKWGYCPPPEVNLGVNVPQMIGRRKPEAERIGKDEIERCLLACNALHTNFVRGNGFVISEGELVCKPPGAVALDGEQYRPLHGAYTAMILSPGPPVVRELLVRKNVLQEDSIPRLAISGPQIVCRGRNVVRLIPVRPREDGQTIGNEINYYPDERTRTSFTAFGTTEEGCLIAVSMFAGRRGGKSDDDCVFFKSEPGQGITLTEMADLLIALGATDAIAGGGSGDTQQFIKRHGLWAGEPRKQEGRPQVEGLRGLGAILSILSCQ